MSLEIPPFDRNNPLYQTIVLLVNSSREESTKIVSNSSSTAKLIINNEYDDSIVNPSIYDLYACILTNNMELYNKLIIKASTELLENIEDTIPISYCLPINNELYKRETGKTMTIEDTANFLSILAKLQLYNS
jgi:glutathionyl-hydroquinone reductase